MLYETIFRPMLFRLDAERAHEMTTALLSLTQNIPGGPGLLSWSLGRPAAGLETEVLGLRFPNPIGLAAGFDKDCRLVRILPSLGFGFLELGSVTLNPQQGNPRPRIFRVPEASALINRLGFNSGGVDAATLRLKSQGFKTTPIGINIGINADCPKEQAAEQYAQTFRRLEPCADYFAVNVSSPNTPGLRDLQERLQLEKILTAIQSENKRVKPILVKLSPDLSDDQLPDLVGLIRRSASGVIAANTTLSRDGVPPRYQEIPGGLSGSPLRSRSTELIRKIYRLTEGRLPIIGVGGVITGADAFEKIAAGASLVQLYTGLIYRGPAAAVRIQSELAELLARSAFKTISEAVGSSSREVPA